MMTTIKYIAGLVVLARLSGCSSPSSFGDYFGDRGRDFSDMWVVGVGYGRGLHVRATPTPVGIGVSRTREVGWDGRDAVRLSSWYRESTTAFLPPGGALDVGMVSSQEISWDDVSRGNIPEGVVSHAHSFAHMMNGPSENTTLTSLKDDSDSSCMFGLEATAGVVSARFGVDPFQGIDFILGFLLLDLYRDDSEAGRAGPVDAEEEDAEEGGAAQK